MPAGGGAAPRAAHAARTFAIRVALPACGGASSRPASPTRAFAVRVALPSRGGAAPRAADPPRALAVRVALPACSGALPGPTDAPVALFVGVAGCRRQMRRQGQENAKQNSDGSLGAVHPLCLWCSGCSVTRKCVMELALPQDCGGAGQGRLSESLLWAYSSSCAVCATNDALPLRLPAALRGGYVTKDTARSEAAGVALRRLDLPPCSGV